VDGVAAPRRRNHVERFDPLVDGLSDIAKRMRMASALSTDEHFGNDRERSMGINHNQAQRSTSAPGGRMHTFEVGDTVQGRYYGEDDGEMKWYAGIVVSVASSRVEVKFDADRKVDSFRLPEDANRKGFVRVLEANALFVTKPTTHVFIGGLVPVA
jgi:hypothetical protein